MKILATIVIAPHMSVSGAVNAASSLSQSIAKICEIDVAIMSTVNATETLGNTTLIKCKAYNPLSFTQGFMPNKVRTLLYRSHMSELIKQGKYDLVHIHNPIPTLEMKAIAKTCVKNSIPYVVSTHGFFEVTSGGDAYQLTRFYEKLAWKYLLQSPLQYVCDNASLIYALSPFEDDILTKNLNIPKDKIRIVTNGIDPQFLISVPTETQHRVTKKYGLPVKNENTAPVCLFLGNHTANKGINILLDGFKQVKHDFVLIIGGKKRDNINYSEIEAGAKKNQQIIFTDMIDSEDLSALLQYADLFVYPTLSDTLPLVILEAMASHLPIIASNVGGIPFQITPENGILIDVGNDKAFAVAVDKLLNKPENFAAMGQASFRKVNENFDWDQSAVKAVKYYKTLLNSPKNNV